MALITPNPVNVHSKSKIPRKMPRSRRRHHSHSRSRSRSHSYDREREPKRRKLDGYESPRHRRSLSFEEEPSLMRQIRNEDTTQEPFALKSSESDESQITSCAIDTKSNKNDTLSSELSQTEESLVLRLSENDESQTSIQDPKGLDVTEPNDNIRHSDSGALDAQEEPKADQTEQENNSGINKGESGSDLEPIEIDSENDCSFSKSFLSAADLAEMKSKIKENVLKTNTGKPMSPKNLQKKIESELRKEQKRIEREEKEKKRQELKEEKLKQKQEKEEQRKKELEAKQKEKEKKRKEKEELEEQKRKEREQEKLKRQQEIEEKNKEKQKLEERKQKTAAVFASFFTKKPESLDDCTKKPKEPSEPSLFKPFEIKLDMRLAPRIRTEIDDSKKTELMNHLEKQNGTNLYLQELKNGKAVGSSPKTWFSEDNDINNDDVVIIDETPLGQSIFQEDNAKASKMKAKFLMFHDNRRPAYFGTWRKKSKYIKPRKPLLQDKENFDYEVDSDDDWEDEEDAGEVESLKGSDEEEKEASDNEYEVDNEFFVPHGHLSDDEMNDEEEKPLSPETHKAHLKLLKNEFDEERKSKTMRIKPRILGCVWQNKVKDNVDEALQKFLEPFSVICVGPIKIIKRSAINNQSPYKKISTPKKLEKEYIPAFLALVHGNVRNRKFLVNEFMAYLRQKEIDFAISKASLSKELQSLAKWTKCPEEGPMLNKLCWFVPENVRREYQLDLTLPNNWNYIRKDSID
ncbi:chromatin assembly factor 1 subunit A-like isoform X2 [Agrilus planipennis]|uniref:Chromatin assembly factor 1 subunit A-like isoform X2 n=1 Tax=Agrilus planipennis TaxID=224129 RepID=A0A1W4X7F0_AGRPL|nr:chromatin assembly factor 1 subunit A-like isoform X2 [Agrilus planipennis]